MTVGSAKGKSIGYLKNPRVAFRLFIRWLVHGTGMLSSNLIEVAAWLRSYDDPEMVDKIDDLASSPHEPDMEIFTYAGLLRNLAQPNSDACYWSLLQVPLRPSSIGLITLADNSPFTPPVIHANYFSTNHDRLLSIWAFKKSCDIAKGSGAFVSWEAPKRADELSDDEILEYLKNSANSCYHPCGTAKIGAESDGGVVDTSLSVYGVPHLRVCDASVMPRIISGHTCAPVIAIAEKLADMLKNEYCMSEK
jgi:choline dehydrogenase